ncbi:hypothetical protein [Antrihabitans cavernicola]|nr:hypothetical protein [Spelaeibacter cavernicola]
MNRTLRILVALLIPLVVLTGCSGKTSSPSSSSAGTSIPADPSGSSSDAAPIDQQCPDSNATSFAKTKFAGHLALGFGAFHRYLYKPYQAGTFKKGADGRIVAFVKGGLSALFIKREVRLASEDVKASPALCKAIAAPLAKLGDTLEASFDKLKNGDASGITDANSLISSIETSSSQNGDPIKEDDNADISSNPK